MTVDYTSVDLVKAQLGIEDDQSDDLIQAAVTAASRSIDRWTGTTFYPVVEARVFAASADGTVLVDWFASTTGLVVKTGSGGTFTSTLDTAGVVPLPYNAPRHGRAYDRIQIPAGVSSGLGYPNIEITLPWGFSEIPDDVELACRIKAAALYRRKDSPEQFGGALDETSSRLSRFEDSDVASLLAPFRLPEVG